MYAVKCSHCKEQVDDTDNLTTSAAGGTCERCATLYRAYRAAMDEALSTNRPTTTQRRALAAARRAYDRAEG